MKWWRKKRERDDGYIEFGDVILPGTGTPKNAAEMLRMARKHQHISNGPEFGLAISLEAALLALREERLRKDKTPEGS
jgi:hypothetical protein